MNGGAMILAFLITLGVTSIIKFGSVKQSLMAMITYIALVAIGTVFYYFIKIDLRRRNAEQQGHTVDVNKIVAEADASTV
mgnify:CR=1 FL=1|jgi:cytochrome c biogenesis protein CcdA